MSLPVSDTGRSLRELETDGTALLCVWNWIFDFRTFKNEGEEQD
jgi:hypothetical protein